MALGFLQVIGESLLGEEKEQQNKTTRRPTPHRKPRAGEQLPSLGLHCLFKTVCILSCLAVSLKGNVTGYLFTGCAELSPGRSTTDAALGSEQLLNHPEPQWLLFKNKRAQVLPNLKHISFFHWLFGV